MGRVTELSNIDIDSVAALSDYCLRASQLLQDLQNEFEVVQQYMKAECAKLPAANDDSHMPNSVRAWQVSRHAAKAAEECHAAKKEMAKMYGAFRRHYVPDKISSKKSKINVNEQ
jgi:hypothetical protein